MKTVDKTVRSLFPLIKDKNYYQINDIVREWAKSRTNEEETDRGLKYASLSGILEASITSLLDHIKELEKNKL